MGCCSGSATGPNDKNGQELFDAASRGDEAGIEKALEKRADVNWSRPGENYTPLMVACWNRHSKAALLLIRRGARVNIANTQFGSTALHIACFHGLTDVVNSLLACEADFDAANKAGNTPIDDAKTRGHKEIVSILQDKRSSMFGFDAAAGRELARVCKVGAGGREIDAAKKALDNGADVDFNEDASNYTPLMIALWSKREDLACFLMDKGADINLANKKFGSTALHIACRNGLGKATQALLDKGAETKCADSKGKMPIEEARAQGHDHILQLFQPGNPMGPSMTGASGSQGDGLPEHWSTALAAFPTQGWMAVWLDEGTPLFKNLENLLATDGSKLNQGRDVLERGTYSSLKLKCAWRIENPNLWKRYDTERDIVGGEVDNRGFTLPKLDLRKELADVSGRLPGEKSKSAKVNEVHLLHGMKPDTVLTILQNGCNMRFSNGNFGQGTYLAEDAGKSDQYCIRDTGDDPSLEEMHTRLYRKDGSHVPHPGDVYYVVLVRSILGYFVRTQSGDAKAKDMDFGENVFATPDRRELACIPKVVPPVHYHSMVVEMGAAVKRYREFVQFHEARLYPEYLLAYQRM